MEPHSHSNFTARTRKSEHNKSDQVGHISHYTGNLFRTITFVESLKKTNKIETKQQQNQKLHNTLYLRSLNYFSRTFQWTHSVFLWQQISISINISEILAKRTGPALFVSLKFGLWWCLYWFVVREKYCAFAKKYFWSQNTLYFRTEGVIHSCM